LFSVEVSATPGSVNVQTTEGRGMNSEEIAANAVAKIISISDTADPIIKAQAEAFRERMYWVIVAACDQSIKSDRTTLFNLFKTNGHGDMAEILRTL
jgi:hypothetical protein|tara:strand:+ start:189 stop:479 length:291 start_codon:yes stop_codon:yes gene_type:complete